MSPKGNISPPISQTCQEKNFLGIVTAWKCPFQRSINPLHPRVSYTVDYEAGSGRGARLSILGHLLLFILAKNSGRAQGAIYSPKGSLTANTLFIYISRVYCSLTFLVIKSVHPRFYLVTNQL